MKRFLKFRYGQGGFTLIELLIVIAILGVLAAVVIPNAQGFMTAGTLNAANTEVANVKTASVGYMAENEGNWPLTSGALGDYLEGTLKAVYTFGEETDTAGTYVQNGDSGTFGGVTRNANGGMIISATPTDGWTNISWDTTIANQRWIRTP